MWKPVALVVAVVIAVVPALDAGPPCDGSGNQHRHRGAGHHGGRGGGGCGNCQADASRDADRALFHVLLDNRERITRTVTVIENGVETLTESDDAAVAESIRTHTRSMKSRLEDGRPIHMRDPLFAEIFANAARIEMTVEETERGVRVRETSPDPHVARLIQAHADVIGLFLENGHAEVRKNHEVPASGSTP